jgi:phosphatidylinositol alpha-1,6-mannosyltransferase
VKHVFVTQDYGPDLGGMARRHVELCRRFEPDSVAVSTVAAPDAPAFDRGERYAVHRQPFPFAGAKRFSNQVRWARWLGRFCREHQADVVHCGNVRPAGYPVWWVHRRQRMPYLIYVNGLDLMREREKASRSRVKRSTARLIFEGAAGIVANSAWTADLARTAMREAGVGRTPPVAAIDLGTDPTHFRPERDGGALRRRLGLGDAPLLVTVARLVPHKGQDVALRALALLRSDFPTLRYLVVGRGPDEARLRTLASELGVADRAVFAGALDDAAVAEAYATATLYVGLSRVDRVVNVEGFGIAFVEAGASGTPSVAGDSGGVRAAVRDGETGVLVPPTDPEAVAAAVHRLLADPVRREAMGRSARLAVEHYYNWDRVARDTLEFTRDVVAGHPSPFATGR